MNAVRKDELPEYRPRKRRKQPPKTNPYRGMIAETSIKFGVNVFLSSVAIVSLLQLLPYHATQKSKLEEVSREVEKTETRVNQLRDNFNRNFASGAETKVMQEQNNLIPSNQLRVVISPNENTSQISSINQD